MDRRPLGRSELVIEPLVLGGNVFGWTVDEAKGFDILDAYVEAGFTAIDTAEGYPNWVPGNPPGMSETIIGKWMKARGNREAVHIFTKVNSGKKPGGLSAKAIHESVEASLNRLQTDYIDLYFSHWPDAETSHEETLAAYDPLVRSGRVRVIGASNYTAEMVREAQQTAIIKSLPRYDVLQPRYNLYDRAEFEALRDQARDLKNHTLANLEHHHFKYDVFRQPGDLHVHMFGTATLSFADGIGCREGDEVEISAPGFGVPLKNRLAFKAAEAGAAQVKVL